MALWFSNVFEITPFVDTAVQPTTAAVVRPTAVIARSMSQPVKATVVMSTAPASPVDTRPAPQATAETVASQASSEAQDLQQAVDARNAENAAHANESAEQNTLDSLLQMQAVEKSQNAAIHAEAEQTRKAAEAAADAQAAQKKAECEAAMASSEMNTLMSLLPEGQTPDVDMDCE